jgi:DNA-binding MarR family transcriptional regulator
VSKRRRQNYERFVALHHWMLRSPAWATMKPNAKALLLHIWQRHNCSNNWTISYAVREAEEIGLKRSHAAEAIQMLIDRGFIVCTRQSAFSVKNRAARCWRITAEPAGDQPATKDFMRWLPSPKFKTQSALADLQSAPPDCRGENETKLPLTVRPTGLSGPDSGVSQSARADISNIPCEGGPNDGDARDGVALCDASLWLRLLAESRPACLLLTALDHRKSIAPKNLRPLAKKIAHARAVTISRPAAQNGRVKPHGH